MATRRHPSDSHPLLLKVHQHLSPLVYIQQNYKAVELTSVLPVTKEVSNPGNKTGVNALSDCDCHIAAATTIQMQMSITAADFTNSSFSFMDLNVVSLRFFPPIQDGTTFI